MIGAVILAGGLAGRAGGPKIVWEFDGKPSIVRVCEAALGCAAIGRTVVVSGFWDAAIREALAAAGLSAEIVYNPRYAEGQSTSLRAGLAALGEECRAVIFLLADQPFIEAGLLSRLAEAYLARPEGKSVAAPWYEGRRRNPVLFDLERWRAALSSLDGDRGARDLLRTAPAEILLLELAGPTDMFEDFDSREEYERLVKKR